MSNEQSERTVPSLCALADTPEELRQQCGALYAALRRAHAARGARRARGLRLHAHHSTVRVLWTAGAPESASPERSLDRHLNNRLA